MVVDTPMELNTEKGKPLTCVKSNHQIKHLSWHKLENH